jgi:hypothetical protein
MFPVKYELGFYIPEDCNLHSHRRKNLNPHLSVHCRLHLQGKRISKLGTRLAVTSKEIKYIISILGISCETWRKYCDSVLLICYCSFNERQLCFSLY